ncbi:hypothetical protein PENTCL1PPCAC_1070, partial [Pristionchus entomophagus]
IFTRMLDIISITQFPAPSDSTIVVVQSWMWRSMGAIACEVLEAILEAAFTESCCCYRIEKDQNPKQKGINILAQRLFCRGEAHCMEHLHRCSNTCISQGCGRSGA